MAGYYPTNPPTGGGGRAPTSGREPPNFRWWVPSEGISRAVIQAEIQRFLGADAYVRVGDKDGLPGYWLSAYRTLTPDMIADLKKLTIQAERQYQQDTPYGAYGQQQPAYDGRDYGLGALGPTPAPSQAQPAYNQPSGYPYQAPDQRYPTGSQQPQVPPVQAGYPGGQPQYQSGYAQPGSGYPQASTPSQYPAYTTSTGPQAGNPGYGYPNQPQQSGGGYPAAGYAPQDPRVQPSYPSYTQPQQQQQQQSYGYPSAPAGATGQSTTGVRPGYYLATDGKQYPYPPGN